MTTPQPEQTSAPLWMADYDYDLPPELIAQHPVEPRDASRLMVVDRASETITHRQFRDLPSLLSPGDLLIVNDTRVMPARLHGRRPTGGQVELLLLRRLEDGCWEAMGRPARRLRPGTVVHLRDQGGHEAAEPAEIVARRGEGLLAVRLPSEVEARLDEFGEMPLPPYIRARLEDPERYQTVFATEIGSAAAPTAGLHFTPRLLAELEAAGIRRATITLHVGLGTFLPVKVEDARQHRMHQEWYHVPAATLAAIREAREAGRRVVAVGTTACRTLESIAPNLDSDGDLSDWTDLFIVPGYRFQVVDALVTNFHLPRSTLLLLVSAFAGRDLILRAYEEAVRTRYRFYSFGDAMFIL